MTRCYEVYMILCPSPWHHAHIVIQSQHIQLYRYNHTHTSIHIQPCNDVALRYVTHSHDVMQAQTHNVLVFTLQTFVFIIRSCCWQHCLWICGKQPKWTHTHAIIVDYTLLLAVYGRIWSCDRHANIIRALSRSHTSTIIQIQSYRYNHAHTTMQWCCTLKSESGPWKALCTYNVQLPTVST